MNFPNIAGFCKTNDEIVGAELARAGISINKSQLSVRQGEVKTSLRGELHGWYFERAWCYWIAKGPGLQVEIAERLWKHHGADVRLDGDIESPSPREVYKGLGCGFYHVDTEEGLRALAEAINSHVVEPEPPYAEANDVGEEIERKFLVRAGWREAVVAHSAEIQQGYLNSAPERSVRVRIQDQRAVLTVKGLSDEAGERRPELNKQLSREEADFMLSLVEPGRISKTRHFIPFGDHVIEVDEFMADNAGLVLAEITLTRHGEAFEKPQWLGSEVTGEVAFYNSCLAQRPFNQWTEAEKASVCAS